MTTIRSVTITNDDGTAATLVAGLGLHLVLAAHDVRPTDDDASLLMVRELVVTAMPLEGDR